MSDEQVVALAERLEAIAEELADLAIDRIRGSLRGHDDEADGRIDERRITRARRAVEKAVALLRAGDADAETDG